MSAPSHYLACPFCGSASSDDHCYLRRSQYNADGGMECRDYVECRRCGAIGPASDPYLGPAKAFEQARDRWNARATPEARSEPAAPPPTAEGLRIELWQGQVMWRGGEEVAP